jgi:hypothetical protein
MIMQDNSPTNHFLPTLIAIAVMRIKSILLLVKFGIEMKKRTPAKNKVFGQMLTVPSLRRVHNIEARGCRLYKKIFPP